MVVFMMETIVSKGSKSSSTGCVIVSFVNVAMSKSSVGSEVIIQASIVQTSVGVMTSKTSVGAVAPSTSVRSGV